ncbi:MAG: PEP-CTERM/exosortase system-associated acyltransferase, partial [Candidatus Competibacteraceae bacterium]
MILADTEVSRVIHRKIRYQVYCLEQQFENPTFFPFGEESDRWDPHAAQFIVRQRNSGAWVAAMRLVLPYSANFPLETLHCLTPGHADHVRRRALAEISRICVIRSPDPHEVNAHLNRNFGHVAGDRESQVLLGLIRTVVIYGLQSCVDHCYLLVTEAFARLLNRLGVVLRQVGIATDHRGLRIPYMVNLQESAESLSKRSALAGALFARPELAYQPYSALGGKMYPPFHPPLPLPLLGRRFGASHLHSRRHRPSESVFGPGKPGPPEPFGDNTGKPTIPLLRWSHVVGTFEPSAGIKIYLDGKLLAKTAVQGEMTPAANAELRIGRDPRPMRPTHTERPKNTNPFNYSFDGLFDEIKVHDHALSAAQVDGAFREVKPRVAKPLEFRKIPTGPAGPGKFGAYHTRLKYDPDYDRPRPFGPQQDVVVRFDEHAFKLVFWNGINHYPVWYAENDIGLMWEAVETSGPLGCHEAMMDRQCRYSHVRILESSDARVRIHWRHAPCNIEYGLAHVDPVTGWGDWCDEYLTIYPDGVAARELVHWCPRPNSRHTYEQDNFIIPIGMTPAEVLDKEAITLANLDGDESKLDWAETGMPTGRNIENASILKYNIKATAKPFMILHPEMAKVALEGNGKPWPHCFFWWNHWPVSAIPSDGKQIYMVDGRPSSTSVSGNTYTTQHALNERTENSLRQIWLLGMTTDRSAGALAPLARSWSRPPVIAVESGGVTPEKYSLGQRCYQLACKAPVRQPIELVIAASNESPVVNIPLVLTNFGNSEVTLELDGAPVPRGKDFRYGHEGTLDGMNLCVWIRLESMQPVRLKLRGGQASLASRSCQGRTGMAVF